MKLMKTLLMSIAAVGSAVFIAGCDDLPTPERMKTISIVVGKTAGYACELSKTKASVKDAIMQVLDIAVTVVPESGQTFTEAWSPIIDAELAKLVVEGKLDEAEVPMTKFALKAATEGLDYIFVKHPKAKNVKDLVAVAVDGFVAGYKSVVTLSGTDAVVVDEEAYKYITEKLAK